METLKPNAENPTVFDHNVVFYKEENGKVVATETVSKEDMERVDSAAKDVMRVYRVEEIFHMIMSALLEFNNLVFQRADQLRLAKDEILDHELFRIRINQCAATFLTTLDMYQSYLCKSKENPIPPFSINEDRFVDDRFGICKAVRNYIQHVSTIDIISSWGRCRCARNEEICVISVVAGVDEMKRNKDKMRKSTWMSLSKFIDGKKELDLFKTFNSVVDVLFAIQNEVRTSHEYAVEYENSLKFLSDMHAKLREKGFFLYRFDSDDELECRGQLPNLFDVQCKMIDYLRQRYKVEDESSKGNFYATTAPKDMVSRMAEADRIVERDVKSNGVVAVFGKHKIISSRYTTKKMRERYKVGVKGNLD